MKDLMGMMKQAQALQQRVTEMQAEMDNLTVEGLSGGGMVKLTLTAKGALKSLSIDPSLMKDGEGEILEDLIVAAHADARLKADRVAEEKMKAVAGGLPLPPGLKLF
ncbi:YbaB/EbfC family nucleoid-associated protein [Terrarubrum flagellatum]|uniref:YbaB/EbfC family nucleoid-associated protein n=1 Tax=Terrirubrum flagellatum TaxID=2895980 RepID=UPI003145288F